MLLPPHHNLVKQFPIFRMVRTYTFNPSTQSSLSTSLPALPTAAVFAHSASFRRRAVPPPSQNRHNLPPPDPPLRNVFSPKASSSLSDAFSPAATISTDRRQVMLEEEPTTFIGIRTVLINGQRFFQPVTTVPADVISSSVGGSVPVDPIAPLLALSAVTNDHRHPKLQKQKHFASDGPSFPPPAAFIPPQSAVDTPPWLRGNPQPRNGQRGSHAWQEAFEGKTKPNFGATFGSELDDGWREANKTKSQEKHRMELMAQIEENRQQKMRERQREWELEEKERIKNELYQQKMRMELEEERRKEREKALMAELKMVKLAAAQRATEETMRAAQGKERNGQGKAKDGEQSKATRRRGETEPLADYFESNGTVTRQQQQNNKEEEELEWWERKDRRRKMEEANGRGERDRGRGTSGDSRRNGASAGGKSAYEPTVISRQRTIDTDNGRANARRDEEHFFGR